MNENEYPEVKGCIDIDVGFSPSTNTLPIRRLKLTEGESAEVKAALFQFPNMELASLTQIYTREAGNKYLFESPENWFACTIETNQDGLVTKYPGFWIDERAT